MFVPCADCLATVHYYTKCKLHSNGHLSDNTICLFGVIVLHMSAYCKVFIQTFFMIILYTAAINVTIVNVGFVWCFHSGITYQLEWVVMKLKFTTENILLNI